MNSRQRRTVNRSIINHMKRFGRFLQRQVEEWEDYDYTKEEILKQLKLSMKGIREL